MNKAYTPSSSLQKISLLLFMVGIIATAAGLWLTPTRTWANILLGNYYFLSIALGALFFIAIQYISQSGWSAMFRRVPEALAAYIPVAGAIMLLLLFGTHQLYHWSHHEAPLHDTILQHKSVYLNIPFFSLRIVLFFTLWVLSYRTMRRLSLLEDTMGGMEIFHRMEQRSKVFIFILAFSFSLLTFDVIMSIDAHWFSTIFALKNIVAAFYHGSVVIVLTILLLHDRGYFPRLNKHHLLDLARYIFMLCIVWGWFWFSQFMLIWYANIPEETIYYTQRMQHGWQWLFYLNIFINWFVPFVVLMARSADRKKWVLKTVCIILIIGQWTDLFLQIMPGTVHNLLIGWQELGIWTGFAGLFIWITIKVLSKAPLIPQNHPYINESIHHHTH